MRKISAALLALSLIGCAKSPFQSSAGGAGAQSDKDLLVGLNQLASTPVASLSFTLSPVTDVEVQSLQPVQPPPPPTCGCGGSGIYECPVETSAQAIACPVYSANAIAAPEMPSVVAYVSGSGSIALPALGNLVEAIIFDPSLSNGEKCLDMAEDALITGQAFNVSGAATLVPLPSPQPLELGGLQSVTTNAVSASSEPAPASSGGGSISGTPIFFNPWVAVYLTRIDSCSEAGVATPN